MKLKDGGGWGDGSTWDQLPKGLNVGHLLSVVWKMKAERNWWSAHLMCLWQG